MSGLESVDGGRRYGSEPEGEAWFVEGMRSVCMLAMRRYVCCLLVGIEAEDGDLGG